MPVPLFLAFLGKAAASVLSKGLSAKGVAGGTKAYGGHHGRHALARKAMGKIAEKAVDKGIDGAIDRKQDEDKKAHRRGST
jgi:hypothetical protein